MYRFFLCIIVSICFLFLSTDVHAQKELTPQKVIKPSIARLAPAEAKLKNIESILSRIESQKLVKEGDGETMEKQMYEYAEFMKSAFDEALKQAEEASKSQGKSGSVEPLGTFETTAKSHEARLNKIEGRIRGIEAKIKTGEIKLDKPILQKMTPAEIEEFQKFLAPEGLKQMQKLHPDIFKPGMKQGAYMNPSRDHVGKSTKGLCPSIYTGISDFFVGKAEASVAAKCIGVCIAQKWSECLSCVVSAGSSAVAAWNEFVKCWNGCCDCKWYKPGCCWCKAKCLAKFIAKIA